ncbi:MAG: hypothetical protein IT236_04440, partial [Bacteroidia bacterium]|nr:hypothetical protein [Bacteroidia bacterium]
MIKNIIIFLFLLCSTIVFGQSASPAPYCNGSYSSGQCNQPGASNLATNFVNDFINCVQTTGGNTNINNCNSGCNGNANNYAFYCQHYLQVSPGQTISMAVQSGITYQQGFAVFVDWNQDNTFSVPGERVAGTSNVPAAATFTTLSFVIPATVAPGAYRMRVRCAYATPGTNITPCGNFGFGETEDYMIYVGPIPPNVGVVSLTATANSTIVCAGQTFSLGVTPSTTAALTYTWLGPNSYTNTGSNFILANVSPSISGVYTINANSACPASTTLALSVVPYPSYTIIPSFTICQGGSISSFVTFTAGSFNSSNYTYSWAPSPGAGIFSPNASVTPIAPLLLPTTVSLAVIPYSVTVSPTVLSCPLTQTFGITINNPLTPTLTLPAPICNTAAAVQLTANPGGGTWTGISGLSSSGLLNPALAPNGANNVMYSVAVGTCIVSNGGVVQVAQYNSPALSSSISLACVQDPLFNLMNIVQTTTNTSIAGWTGGPYVTTNNFFNPANLASGSYNLTFTTISTPTMYATVCPGSTVISVQVFNPPTPTIAPIAPKCNTSPTIALSATPLGGSFNGNSGVTSGGIQTPSSNVIGTNTIIYTAGIGTCVASSSATFHVSQFNTAALTNTASIAYLCSKNGPVNLMSLVQNTTGIWTGPNVATGASASSYSFSPTGLPTNTYSLIYNTVSTPNALICPDSRTIVVS